MAEKKKTKKRTAKGKKRVTAESEAAESQPMVTIYIMGKAYRVPGSLTILTAMEYAGYQVKRGAGCREGFCGACATVYRTKDDYKLKTGLACQTVVEDGMYLAQIPFVPANRADYQIKEVEPTIAAFQRLYPEVFRCVSCNTCTKSCPQDIEVMDYIQAVIRGDIAKAADLSFDCIMCGLCAARCPAEIVQYYVGILARRLYGKYLAVRTKHLEDRLKEMDEKAFDKEIEELMNMDRETLQQKYKSRDMEPK